MVEDVCNLNCTHVPGYIISFQEEKGTEKSDANVLYSWLTHLVEPLSCVICFSALSLSKEKSHLFQNMSSSKCKHVLLFLHYTENKEA